MNAKKVLYIEDDRMLYDLIHDVISPIGELEFAPDLNVALDLLSEKKFDFIIADVDLPDGNSLEFFQALKEQEMVDIPPIIFLSGQESTNNKILGYKVGGVDYLVKPANPSTIAARVELLMRTGS